MNSEERLKDRVYSYEKSKRIPCDYPVKAESIPSKIAWQTYMAKKSREKALARKHLVVACVYGLVDPCVQELFYVGCTSDLHRRMKEHRNKTLRVKKLTSTGRETQVLILELNPLKPQHGDWPWIEFFTNKGIKLEQTVVRGSSSVKRGPYRKRSKEVVKRIW